jgi:hypothetical protein
MNGPANSYMAALQSYLGGKFDIPADNVQGQKPSSKDPVFVKYKADVYKMCEESGRIYDIEQFCKAAQLINYDNHRGLFDALSVKRSNGLLMWMSQSSWPSFMWQTYDYYLDCNGGYYGCKSGCAPVKAVFDPRNDEIVLANATPNRVEDIEFRIELFNLWGKPVSVEPVRTFTLEPDAYGVIACKADFSKSDTDVCFLRLTLGAYQTTYWHNRREYQNYVAIGALPESEITLSVSGVSGVATHATHATHADVTVTNAGNTPSLMTRVRVVDDTDADILPVFWSDNYFALMPGDSRQISVEFTGVPGQPLRIAAGNAVVPLS